MNVIKYNNKKLNIMISRLIQLMNLYKMLNKNVN